MTLSEPSASSAERIMPSDSTPFSLRGGKLATAGGMRALTTTAGPGFSLKQEGISYLCGSDLPAVIVDVQRIGCALGDIFMGQGDYWQLTRGGGHATQIGRASCRERV